EIDRIVIRDVQYKFEVNWCRNKEVIVKGNFGWADGNGAMHNVQYQFKVNRCRNEEVIVKGNFWWAWVGNGAMQNVQYQLEVNWCRNEEVNFQGSSALDERTEDGDNHNIPLFLRKAWG
ncbi:hypothetical protein DPMN_097313, partial [Dreissena polymorpha]